MLETVLQILPSTWASKSYNNKSFYLVELPIHSAEYVTIDDYFANYTVLSIERVQNPYQWGRYEIYKLQRNSPSESLCFMPLQKSSQLEIALRYNCDYRRLNYSNDMFFPTVSGATIYNTSSNKVIVLQRLTDYSNHDSGRYPKYVVTYQRSD